MSEWSSNHTGRVKKQFKSQSVNDLFRQQTSANQKVQTDNHVFRRGRITGSSSLSPSLSPSLSSSGTTKLKLSNRRSISGSGLRIHQRKQELQQTSPAWKNRSNDQEQTSSDIKTTIENNTYTRQSANDLRSSSFDYYPASLNTNEDHDDDWLDLQSSITNETQSKEKVHSSPDTSISGASRSWSVPNSKLSSFRKPTTPNIISSLNESPLSKPIDSPSLLFFTENALSNGSNEHPWKSPNIWNNEERQLSTKSDSSVLWSPFENDRFSLDEPARTTASEIPELVSRSSSRFFPSPLGEQEETFKIYTNEFQQPPPAAPIFTPSSFAVHQLTSKQSHQCTDIQKPLSDHLITQTCAMEQQLFAHKFEFDYSNISVSLPDIPKASVTEPFSTAKKMSMMNEHSYPEGFSSTFYKRGVNNFMFVRELQSKLTTSKMKETAEVRVSLPSITIDESSNVNVFKMRCYIINVGLRDLDKKLGGLRIGRTSPHSRGKYSGGSHYQRGSQRSEFNSYRK